LTITEVALSLMLLASLAVALALVGIWGTVSCSVSQRIPEIGIRIALGASAGEIVWMVIRQATVLVVGGVVVGLAGAGALSRFLQGLLFAIKPTDAFTFAAVAVLLAAVALLACYLPARRAWTPWWR
jgi:putative ABC transport system permease protein